MKKWNTALWALGLCCLSSLASAAPPFTAKKVTVNARLQYGIDLEGAAQSPYGLGLAAAGGYTLDSGIYVGGNFDYFFGGSTVRGNDSIKLSFWQLMANAGYDIGLSDAFVLRPYAGVGLARLNAEWYANSVTVDWSTTGFALALGAAPIVNLGPAFVLADLRMNLLFGANEDAVDTSTAKAIFIGLGGGMAF